MFQQFLFFHEVGVLRNMFVPNGYPLWFFEKCFKKFNEKYLHFHSACRDHVYNLNISYFGHDYRRLINSELQPTLKINPVYKTFKVS